MGQNYKIAYQDKPDVFYDGPIKPVRIWRRIGRRPILGGGNSNGDIPMMDFVAHSARPSLSVFVNHDDNERDIACTAGAEKLLEVAPKIGKGNFYRTVNQALQGLH